MSAAQPPRLYTFAGGESGAWRIARIDAIAGEPLPEAPRLAIVAGDPAPGGTRWRLRGITSNERYVTRAEKADLVAKQEGLGRPGSTCAALIPIRKTAAWWALPQDERRRVFEESSKHVRIGLEYTASAYFLRPVRLRGTLPPARRASLRPIAIACLRLVTLLPDRPERSVPRLRSCIARLTLLCAFLPYFAIAPPG